ncbi:MAG: transcriptional repressor AgaR [Cyclobacteriaceae bacterium]
MAKNTRATTVSRRNIILDQISEKGQVYVDELSKEFGVSEVTIRNDLDQLEQKSLLIRARGGAMKIEGRVGIDYNLSEKDKLNYNEKVRIGQAAAKLITNAEIVLIDSGTTTAEMVKNLNNVEDLTVITNALNIATLLLNHPTVNLTIPGGFLRKKSQSLVGPMAERGLKNFYVDKAFLGVDGFDTTSGLYTPNIEEAHLNELMIEIANEVILLADSSKFKKKSFAFICPVEKIHTVVTDDRIHEDDKRRLEDAGVKVIIA